MKKQITKFLAASVLVALTACNETKTKEKIVYVDKNGNVIETQTEGKNGPRVELRIDEKMSSDDLIQVGEQLIGPYTFHLANHAFELVLQKDPNNKKAQFYVAFLKRYMVFKGILTRVKPYMRTNLQSAQHEKTIKSIPEHPLKSFLLAGQEDIDDLGDIQNFLVEYRDAVDYFRNFLKQNPDLNMTFTMNPSVFNEKIQENLQNSCVAEQQVDGSYKVACDTSDVATIKINSADVVALRQEAAGEVLYLTLLNSHSLKGTDRIWKNLENSQRSVCTQRTESYVGYYDSNNNPVYYNYQVQNCRAAGNRISPEEVMTSLEGVRTFGQLRTDNKMSLVRTLGADFVAAAKWVLDYQAQLCPNGPGQPQNRKGYLMNQGLCVDNASDMERTIDMFERVLKGIVRTDMRANDGQSVTTDLNIMAFFDHPVQDLRQLFPDKYDNCGNGTSLRDRTFGGVFPNKDANRFMLEKNNCGQ